MVKKGLRDVSELMFTPPPDTCGPSLSATVVTLQSQTGRTDGKKVKGVISRFLNFEAHLFKNGL